MIKKISIITSTVLLMLTVTSCSNNDNSNKDWIPGGESQLPGGESSGSDNINLEIQNFDNALEAFKFGYEFFKNSTSFETLEYSLATPQSALAGPQLVTTSRFQSENGDFKFKTANLATPPILVDPSFTFMVASPSISDNVYHMMRRHPRYVTQDGNRIKGDFTGQSLDDFDTVNNMEDIKGVMGVNPRRLTGYIINESTIISSTFKVNYDGSFSFGFNLNQGAVANSRYRVRFFGNQGLPTFRSLEVGFEMDKFGRVIEINTREEYSLRVTIFNITTTVEAREFISYSAQPVINFDDFTVSNGYI